MVSGCFTDEYFFSLEIYVKYTAINQAVVDDNIGPFQTFSPFHRNQAGVTGTGTYQVYLSLLIHPQSPL